MSSVSFLSAGSQECACRLQFILNDLSSAAKKKVQKHFHLFHSDVSNFATTEDRISVCIVLGFPEKNLKADDKLDPQR